MRGFLGCFISELCWSRSLPACSLRWSRAVALFVWICICSSHFHLPPLCPRNHLSESTMTFRICYVFAFPVTAFPSFTQSHRVMETQMQKLAQIIVISEIQDHLHFSLRQQAASEIHCTELGKPCTSAADRMLLLSAPGLCSQLTFCWLYFSSISPSI